MVAWVEDEGLLDPVTAVSGSGPAYVFLLAELMEQAAREQGIPADLARLLARQTVSGSGALLAASTGGCGGVAGGGHQSRRHHGARAGRADDGGGLAGGAQPRDCRGDGAVAGAGGVAARAQADRLPIQTMRLARAASGSSCRISLTSAVTTGMLSFSANAR